MRNEDARVNDTSVPAVAEAGMALAGCAVATGLVAALLPLAIMTETPKDASAFSFVAARVSTDIGVAFASCSVVALLCLCVVALLRPQLLEWYTIVAVTYYILACAALHVLHPENNPIAWPMSTYSLTSSAALMQTTFFVMSAGFFSVGLRLYLAATTPWSFAVLALFVVPAVGMYLAGVYPMDEEFPPGSVSGRLHGVGGFLTFLPLSLAPLIATWILGRRQLGPSAMTWSVVLGVIAMLCSALLLVFIASGYGGLLQRLFFAAIFAWMVMAVQNANPIARGDPAKAPAAHGG